MRDDNCIFCKIANGEIPSETIYEDETFRVILDLGYGFVGTGRGEPGRINRNRSCHKEHPVTKGGIGDEHATR